MFERGRTSDIQETKQADVDTAIADLLRQRRLTTQLWDHNHRGVLRLSWKSLIDGSVFGTIIVTRNWPRYQQTVSAVLRCRKQLLTEIDKNVVMDCGEKTEANVRLTLLNQPSNESSRDLGAPISVVEGRRPTQNVTGRQRKAAAVLGS